MIWKFIGLNIADEAQKRKVSLFRIFIKTSSSTFENKIVEYLKVNKKTDEIYIKEKTKNNKKKSAKIKNLDKSECNT